MKIYSWNTLFRNKELDRAFEFISHADFDIFCLQEVSEEFLKRLQTLPYHLVYRTDVERLFKNGDVHNYIVILSTHPIASQGEIPFSEYWPLLPWRARIFVNLMPSRFFSKIRNRGALYADVTIHETVVRIFNLHLILAQPAWRLKEFEMAMAKRDPSKPTIVCGDFNTLQAPHITPLNWILGGDLADALLFSRERTHIEQRFVEHKLTNPLYGGITHPVSQSQLDHILVSHSFSIKHAEISPDRIGSDHHPIYVETT
ncbi:MAG: endonuclease/exonuclease/phosphatase family protein [Patescibacteria group bacterium]|nr:endonuclease/exonuclease/phosphatase family protein [Patescibacteria group bacterium]